MSYTELNVALFTSKGRGDHDCMVAAFSTTCVISAYHTSVVSSNPSHGEVYSMQQYVIKFVSDFEHFLGIPVFSTNTLTSTI